LKKKTGILLGFEAVRILRSATGGCWKNQSKAQVVNTLKSIFLKIFYPFSHIELRESGIENQEPFSPQSRRFALTKGGMYYF
jgi:hypothetical protein